MAGFVLANGSMSSNQPGEGTIRQALIEADLVDGMVALKPIPPHADSRPAGCLSISTTGLIPGVGLC
jgi:hypothetical protein